MVRLPRDASLLPHFAQTGAEHTHPQLEPSGALWKISGHPCYDPAKVLGWHHMALIFDSRLHVLASWRSVFGWLPLLPLHRHFALQPGLHSCAGFGDPADEDPQSLPSIAAGWGQGTGEDVAGPPQGTGELGWLQPCSLCSAQSACCQRLLVHALHTTNIHALHSGFQVQMDNPRYSRGIRQRLASTSKEQKWLEKYKIAVGE